MHRDFSLSQPSSASSAAQPASDSTAGAAEQPAVNIASTEAKQSSGSAARSSGSAERPADHSADSNAERPDHRSSDVGRTMASLATHNSVCGYCRKSYNSGDDMCRLWCKHVFHTQCHMAPNPFAELSAAWHETLSPAEEFIASHACLLCNSRGIIIERWTFEPYSADEAEILKC